MPLERYDVQVNSWRDLAAAVGTSLDAVDRTLQRLEQNDADAAKVLDQFSRALQVSIQAGTESHQLLRHAMQRIERLERRIKQLEDERLP